MKNAYIYIYNIYIHNTYNVYIYRPYNIYNIYIYISSICIYIYKAEPVAKGAKKGPKWVVVGVTISSVPLTVQCLPTAQMVGPGTV